MAISRRVFLESCAAVSITAAAGTGLTGCETVPASQIAPNHFAVTPAPFPQFSRVRDDASRRFDFSDLNGFLQLVVMDLGPSDRIAKAQPKDTGTRIVPGHNGRYRLEGNRIPFEVFSDKEKGASVRHRAALTSLGNDSDLSAFPWLDQMAYWINLHNIIVIDEIAKAYPVTRPDRIRVGDGSASLYDTKLVTIQGTRLSLNDIRREIVFRHWRAPLSIYGFFDGTVGGPSIQTRAYSGRNISRV